MGIHVLLFFDQKQMMRKKKQKQRKDTGWGSRGSPLLNSLRTKRKPVFVNVFLTSTGVIVLNFHFKTFEALGSLNGVAAS